jgi:nuclear transport factor 2 (NTF2) superfamily protein
MTLVALVPPFALATARAKVRLAEDTWNSRDPDRVVHGYTEDCDGRNRSRFLNGREELHAFLQGKWRRERDYRLIKSTWALGDLEPTVDALRKWIALLEANSLL